MADSECGDERTRDLPAAADIGVPNLTTQYQLPNGLDEAIIYNLAIRRAPDYGKVPSDIVERMALSSLANFKRGNVKLVDMPTDPALTRDPAGFYNIITGTGTNG